MSEPWLHQLSKGAHATVRLVCFPHAGGTASAFRLWPSGLPPQTEVLAAQYPGRANRLDDPLVERVPIMAASIRQALQRLCPMPTIYFGHSMGSVVAYEVCCQLGAAGLSLPRHLIVSGRLPPHCASPVAPLSHLPEADFLSELNRRFSAVPAELMQYPDVLALLVPALRADMVAVEHYQGSRAEILACPVTAFGGLCDPSTTRAHLEAWSELTTAGFQMRVFPGGHFYIDQNRAAVLAEVSTTLTPSYRDSRQRSVA